MSDADSGSPMRVPFKIVNRKATGDQEARVLARLREYTELVNFMKIRSRSMAGAAQPMIDTAINGAMHGVAMELLRLLEIDPIFENIHPDRYNDNNGNDAVHLLNTR